MNKKNKKKKTRLTVPDMPDIWNRAEEPKKIEEYLKTDRHLSLVDLQRSWSDQLFPVIDSTFHLPWERHSEVIRFNLENWYSSKYRWRGCKKDYRNSEEGEGEEKAFVKDKVMGEGGGGNIEKTKVSLHAETREKYRSAISRSKIDQQLPNVRT